MSTRHICCLFLALACVANVGCCGYLRGCGCGFGGQVYNDCCPSCGVAEADCCCPEPGCSCPEPDCCCPEADCSCPEADCCCPGPSCGCAEPACGCDDVYCDDVCCDTQVGCGSCVGGGCPTIGNCWILQRLRNALTGCSGCGTDTYWSEWHNDPPSNCPTCNQYGGSTGGHYGGQFGRRAYLSERHQNISEELRFAEEESGPIYR